MITTIKDSLSGDISACVYTQITDVELECDGFYTYERLNKFSAADTVRIMLANQALIQKNFSS